MAKRRTIPGTNIPIGRKPAGKGITQKQRDQANREIQREIKKQNDPLKDLPFNPDTLPRRKSTRKIFREAGIESYRQIFRDWNFAVGDKNFRGEAFSNPDDLIAYWAKGQGAAVLAAGGLRILYNPYDGFYYAYVEIDSDPYRGS